MSKNKANFLLDGVKELCILESDLSRFDLYGGDFKEHKPRRWSKKKKHYFEAKYTIEVVVEPANIKFELWFKERKCGEKSFSVIWGAGASEPVNPEVRDILNPS